VLATGGALTLTVREFELLVAMARRVGAVITRDEVHATVLTPDSATDSSPSLHEMFTKRPPAVEETVPWHAVGAGPHALGAANGQPQPEEK
jgi:hypothetical protein